MTWTEEQLNQIYDRTSGHCHICRKKLAWNNYGRPNKRASWEVEHSVPKACGGTDRMNNLYAACTSCNRSKQALATRRCRADNGHTRAPMCRATRRAAKAKNSLLGAGLGALAGCVLGPIGAIGGAALGAHFGHKANPDE